MMKPKKLLNVLFLEVCFILHFCASHNFVVTPLHHGTPAVIENENVWTGSNKTAHVLCSTSNNQPIDSCVWSRASITVPGNITNSFNIAKDNQQINTPGFSIYGKGFKSGQCGVSIHNVGINDVGLWNCTLIQSERHNVFLGTVQLRFWEKPLFKPEIESSVKNTAVFHAPKNGGYALDIPCCARKSVPDPTLYFQIDNRTVGQNYSIFKGNDGLFCITWKKAVLDYKMNQKVLHCIMDHIAFTEDDVVHEDTFKLNVEFAPLLIGYGEKDVTKVEIPKDTKAFNFTVIAKANPFPKIQWLIRSKTAKDDMPVEANDNFRLGQKSVNGFDEVQLMLIIVDSNRLAVNESVTLYVSNNYGVAELRIEFTVPDTGKIGRTLIIIGLVAGIILVLAGIIGGFLIFARRRRHKGVLHIKPMSSNTTPTAKLNRAMGEVSSTEEMEVLPVNPPDKPELPPRERPTPPPRLDKELITNV